MSESAGPGRRFSIVGPFPPVRGGIAQFDDRLARELESAGHTVHRHQMRRLYPGVIFPGTSQFEVGTSPPPRGLDPVRPWTWRAPPPSDATVLTYWGPVQAPMLASIARRSPHPRIGLIHNALPHERVPASGWLAGRFLRRCDGVVTLSESVATDVRDLGYSGPIKTTPHPTYDQYGDGEPAEAARLGLGLSPEGPVLLFFGLVRHYKGLDVLIDALANVPGARLLVAGEFYDDAEAYRAQAREGGVDDRIRFEDRFIPDDEVARWFSAADLVVQPYRTATQSGVLNLATHFGKPLVLSGVGGLAETVDRYRAGLVVPPEDPAALAEAIRRALEPDLWRTLAAGSSRMGRETGWPAFRQSLEHLIDSLGY